MNFRSRIRVVTAIAALLLSWFAITTILGETFVSKPVNSSSPRTDDLLRGPAARWIAAAVPLRGDLLSRIAFERSTQLLRPAKNPPSQELLAPRGSALSLTKESLSLAPHSSATWLLLARLHRLASDPRSAIEALKMSFFTGSADFDLIPARLEVVAGVATSADSDLGDLAHSDIRLILTRRPDLKPAIASAYEKGSIEGRAMMYELVKAQDETFASTLR